VSKFELRADFDSTDDTEQYCPDQNSTSHSTTSRITWIRGPSKFELCGDFDMTDDTGEPASDQDSTSHSTPFWQSWTKSPPSPTTVKAQRTKVDRFSQDEEEGKNKVPKKDSYLIEHSRSSVVGSIGLSKRLPQMWDW